MGHGGKVVVEFAREIPGEGGVDWGYVSRSEDARPMTEFWRLRFVKYQRDLGHEARFMDVRDDVVA